MSVTDLSPPKTGLDTNSFHRGWVSYFVMIHLTGVIGIWYAVTNFINVWPIVLFAALYYFLCHLSITVGAHRLYAHEAFRAKVWVQYVLVLLFSGTMQGPITWWAGKHKHHHAREDIPGEDPHTPNEGFWHSHCLWLMKRGGIQPPPNQYVRHFLRDSGQRYRPALWQTEYHLKLGVLMAFALPTAVGWVFGDWLGGFLIGACVRLVFQYHLTWVVNSVGHFFGERRSGSATNNGGLLALLTVGESYHANHHLSPGDYRLGRAKGQIDLGRLTIEGLARCGLATDLKMPSEPQVARS